MGALRILSGDAIVSFFSTTSCDNVFQTNIFKILLAGHIFLSKQFLSPDFIKCHFYLDLTD